MSAFRYKGCDGPWLKGNTHIHSTASDGGRNLDEIAALYHGAGYDFIFMTDHWVCSNAAAHPRPLPLLVLDGVELDGMDGTDSMFHVVCLGTFTGLTREMGLDACIQRAHEQGGIVVLAHPYWSGNTIEDCSRYPFDGVEVYNHVCQFLNGKGTGGYHWDSLLARGRSILGFAADDAHLRPEYPGWNGGWIRLSATERSGPAIFQAVRAGRYYFSNGPEIHSISLAGNRLKVRSSPVRFARLIGENWRGQRLGSYDGARLGESAFVLPSDYRYLRLEIEDERGGRAWTNTLFVD